MGIGHMGRVEPAAAAFGLLVGITMVYVPYEFGASLFQHIYPYIRLLGATFLVGSATMIAAMLYPTGPAWPAWVGRALFLGALATYWWTVNILPRGMTGAMLYPLMAAGVIAEGLPRWRGRGLFGQFLAAVALAFGGLMLVAPTQFGPAIYTALQPVVRPVGLLYLGAGTLLIIGLIRQRRPLARLALAVLGLLFVHMAFVLGNARSWAGMSSSRWRAGSC